jgi:hypothetical protein
MNQDGLSPVERVQITVLSKPLKHREAMDFLNRVFHERSFRLKSDLAQGSLVNALVHGDELIAALVFPSSGGLLFGFFWFV